MSIYIVKHANGLTLLECVLVLVISASIAVGVFKHAIRYRGHLHEEMVNNDVAVIFEAASAYFHTIGCDSSGGFPVADTQPSLDKLGLKKQHQSAPPLIKAFAVAVMKTEHEGFKKPLYQLVLRGTLYSSAVARINYYRQRFHATTQSGEDTLVWRRLPYSSGLVQRDNRNASWLLMQALRRYRHVVVPSVLSVRSSSNCLY